MMDMLRGRRGSNRKERRSSLSDTIRGPGDTSGFPQKPTYASREGSMRQSSSSGHRRIATSDGTPRSRGSSSGSAGTLHSRRNSTNSVGTPRSRRNSITYVESPSGRRPGAPGKPPTPRGPRTPRTPRTPRARRKAHPRREKASTLGRVFDRRRAEKGGVVLSSAGLLSPRPEGSPPLMLSATMGRKEISQMNAAMRRNSLALQQMQDPATMHSPRDEQKACVERSSTFEGGGGESVAASIALAPHVHTRWCKGRPQFCPPPGRYVEGETLVVQGLREDAISGTWMRVDVKTRTKTPVARCADQQAYRLGCKDVGCQILFQCPMNQLNPEVDVEESSRRFGTQFDIVEKVVVFRAVGPVEAAAPQVGGMRIEGEHAVGETLKAIYEYRGGREGPTEVWWLRVNPDGSRENATEPTVVSQRLVRQRRQAVVRGLKRSLTASSLFSESSVDTSRTSENSRGSEDAAQARDPLTYVLTLDDLGCRMKCKVRPVRRDGTVGDVATSQPFGPIRRPKRRPPQPKPQPRAQQEQEPLPPPPAAGEWTAAAMAPPPPPPPEETPSSSGAQAEKVMGFFFGDVPPPPVPAKAAGGTPSACAAEAEEEEVHAVEEIEDLMTPPPLLSALPGIKPLLPPLPPPPEMASPQNQIELFDMYGGDDAAAEEHDADNPMFVAEESPNALRRTSSVSFEHFQVITPRAPPPDRQENPLLGRSAAGAFGGPPPRGGARRAAPA